ncbi:MAG: hypothetical protein HYX32_01330 [Actinobacteria bacterium]|nr:hypothetical protein [Actinomycetota bacterium]
MLADGTYDAFVIDATIEGAGPERIVHLELTITAGERKGDVIAVAAAGMSGDEFDLIGMPATLTVSDGSPRVIVGA